jgi:hypothetical protein
MFNEHGYLQVSTFDDLVEAIRLNEQVGAIGQAHLMRALQQGRICYLSCLPDTSASKFKAFVRGVGNWPAIVLIGDDDYVDRGPNGWSITARAVAWARGILLHAAGAKIEHYEAAVKAARCCGRVLVIDASPGRVDSWSSYRRVERRNPEDIEARRSLPPVPFGL